MSTKGFLHLDALGRVFPGSDPVDEARRRMLERHAKLAQEAPPAASPAERTIAAERYREAVNVLEKTGTRTDASEPTGDRVADARAAMLKRNGTKA